MVASVAADLEKTRLVRWCERLDRSIDSGAHQVGYGQNSMENHRVVITAVGLQSSEMRKNRRTHAV